MNESLKETIRSRCRDLEIPLVGTADVRRWENPPFRPWMPEAFYPRSIFPQAESAIVIGLPVSLPALETSPSIHYRELYNTVNALIDQHTYRLAEFLTARGYPSVFIPRDGYGSIEVLLKNPVAFFSHRHAAYFAGLGNFGVNNMILTPGYGPRVRFGTVLTAAELPSDPVLDDPLCIRCMQCVEMCPSSALDPGEYPAAVTNKHACASWSAELHRRFISPCGICIKVCPVGEDRRLYGHTDVSVYADPGKDPGLHRAWEHVRRYGGK
ncbi:MAG: epoxyqueuosine reductase [Methanomicrobiales archaeon]|nr:epoxyqueuosine reductase [Methanomicrobiales archaeon]